MPSEPTYGIRPGAVYSTHSRQQLEGAAIRYQVNTCAQPPAEYFWRNGIPSPEPHRVEITITSVAGSFSFPAKREPEESHLGSKNELVLPEVLIDFLHPLPEGYGLIYDSRTITVYLGCYTSGFAPMPSKYGAVCEIRRLLIENSAQPPSRLLWFREKSTLHLIPALPRIGAPRKRRIRAIGPSRVLG